MSGPPDLQFKNETTRCVDCKCEIVRWVDRWGHWRSLVRCSDCAFKKWARRKLH